MSAHAQHIHICVFLGDCYLWCWNKISHWSYCQVCISHCVLLFLLTWWRASERETGIICATFSIPVHGSFYLVCDQMSSCKVVCLKDTYIIEKYKDGQRAVFLALTGGQGMPVAMSVCPAKTSLEQSVALFHLRSSSSHQRTQRLGANVFLRYESGSTKFDNDSGRCSEKWRN